MSGRPVRRNRRAAVLVGALFMAAVTASVSWAQDGQDRPVADGAVQVTATPAEVRGHAVPALAVHPDDPHVLALVEGDAYAARCSLHLSSDAGLTWSAQPLPVDEEWPQCMYANLGPIADVAFAPDGTLLVAHSGHDPETYQSRIFVSRSSDLGASWRTAEVPRVERDLDAGQFGADAMPSLVVDPREPDRVYVGWMSNNGTWNLSADVLQGREYYIDIKSRPYVAWSTDGAETFEGPVDLADGEEGWFSQPSLAVGDDGTVHAFFGDNVRPPPDAPEDAQAPPGNLWHSTFRADDEAATPQAIHTRDPKDRDWLSAPSPAVDPATGRLYVVWEESPADAVPFVAFMRSDDGGQTWSDPVAINDVEPQREWNFNEFFPSLAVAANGRLDVAWYDWRDDVAFDPEEEENVFQHVYASYSNDGGDTWAEDLRVSDRAIDRRLGVAEAYGVKGPVGLASTDRAAYVAWDDTRNGDDRTQSQDIYATRVRFGPAEDFFAGAGEPSGSLMPGLLGASLALAAVGLILLVGPRLAGARRPKASGSLQPS